MVLNCTNCNYPERIDSILSTMVVCSQCYSVFKIEGIRLEKVSTATKMQEDMSPITIGTAGIKEGKKFTVIGRTRFIFDDYFLNQWNLHFENNNYAFMGESFGNYSIYEVNKKIFEGKSLKNFKPGNTTLGEGRKNYVVAGVHKTKKVENQGELFRIPTNNDFTHIELLGKNKEMVNVHLYLNGLADVYSGQCYEFEELQLSQLREIKEWK